MTRPPRLVRMASWSFAGDATGKLGMFLAAAIAIAALAPRSFAYYVTLHAVSLLASALWDLGTSPLLTRQLAAQITSPSQGLRQLLRLRVLTAPLLLCAVLVGTLVVYDWSAPSPWVFVTVGVLAASANLQNSAVSALRGQLAFRQAAEAVAAGRLVGAAATLSVATLLEGSGVTPFLWALVAGELVTTTLAALRVPWRVPGPARGAEPLTLRAALPFSLSSLMVLAYNRLDSLVVAALATPLVLDAYAPASRLQDALFLVPFAASTALFPFLARLRVTHSVGLWSRWRRATVLSTIASLAVAFVGFLVLPPLIARFLPAYESSIGAVRIIVWSLPLVAVSSALVAALNASGHAAVVPIGIGIGFATSLALLLVLVPRFGSEGAALAATAREIPTCVVLALLARRRALGPATATAPAI